MTLNYILNAARRDAERKGSKKTTSRLEELQCGEYCEPGYDSKRGLVLANWNDTHETTWIKGQGYVRVAGGECTVMGRLERILDKAGFSTDWSDEYTSCDDCGKYFRTSGDCWDWKQYGESTEHGTICGNCLKGDPEGYLATRIDNPHNAANTAMVDLAAQGFELVADGFANGLHPGMNDNPVKLLEHYRAIMPQQEFVFTYKPSQFYVEFDIWARTKPEGLNYMQMELANGAAGKAMGLEYALA